MRVVTETNGAQVEPAFLLVEDLVGVVHHDLRYRGILEQGIDWPEAEHLVGHGSDQLVADGPDDAGHLLADERAGGGFHRLSRSIRLERLELSRVQLFDEPLVQGELQLVYSLSALPTSLRAPLRRFRCASS